jgi:hypothetical protein
MVRYRCPTLDGLVAGTRQFHGPIFRSIPTRERRPYKRCILTAIED